MNKPGLREMKQSSHDFTTNKMAEEGYVQIPTHPITCDLFPFAIMIHSEPTDIKFLEP